MGTKPFSSRPTNESPGSRESSTGFNLTTEIKDEKALAQSYYNIANSLFSSVGSGIISPSIDNKTLPDKISDYEEKALRNLNMHEAMLTMARYSSLMTGDSSAFIQVMASRGKTMDDFVKFKDAVRTYVSPTSSKNARLASSYYIQKEFGVDTDKDFAELNRATLQIDALKEDMAKAFMNTGAAKESVVARLRIASIPKTEKKPSITPAAIPQTVRAIQDLARMRDDLDKKDPMYDLLEAKEKSLLDLLDNVQAGVERLSDQTGETNE